MKTRPFVLLSLSLLFSLCPSAFPLDDSGENAALAAAFRKAPDRQSFLTELWVKQPVQEAYGEKLYALFLAQKTLEEKARFLQEFQTAKKWLSVPDPLYIGRRLLCLKTAEALDQNPDSPDLRLSLALLLNNNETVVSDTRLGHLGKALELAPGNPLIAQELGWALIQTGNFSQAETLLARYPETGAYATGQNMLAALQLISGKREKALSLLRKENPAQKSPERIFADILLLIRFNELSAARELLNRDEKRLPREHAQYLRGIVSLREGKEKEAVLHLVPLAAPARVRETVMRKIRYMHVTNPDLYRKLGIHPEFLHLELSRIAEEDSVLRSGPILFLSRNSRLFWNLPIQDPETEITCRSILLLQALSRENPDLCATVRKGLEGVGCRYAALYLGSPGTETEALFRKNPDDPLYAELFFTEGTKTCRHFSGEELSGLLKTLRKHRSPTTGDVFRRIYSSTDFSDAEKRELFRGAAEVLLLDVPDRFIPYAGIPEYRNIMTEKLTALLNDQAFAGNEPARYYGALCRYVYLMYDWNRFSELTAALERYAPNCRPPNAENVQDYRIAGFFFSGVPSAGSEQLAHFIDSAYGDPLHLIRHFSGILNRNPDFNLFPQQLDGTAFPLACILDRLLREKRNRLYLQYFSQACVKTPRAEPDWEACWKAIRSSRLPIMLKIAAANRLEQKKEGGELLRTAIEQNPKPTPGFLLNAIAFSLEFERKEQAAELAEQLYTLPEADRSARLIGAMVSLKYRAGKKSDKSVKQMEQLIRMVQTPEERNSLSSFLQRNGYGNEVARLRRKGDATPMLQIKYPSSGSGLGKILPLFRTNPEAGLNALRSKIHSEQLKDRWRFYFSDLPGVSCNVVFRRGFSTAGRNAQKPSAEKMCAILSEGKTPDDLCYAAEMEEKFLKHDAKAAALYETYLKRVPDDLYARWRLFQIQAKKGVDAAQESYRILTRAKTFNALDSIRGDWKDPAAAMTFVELVLREYGTRPMTPGFYNCLLNLLKKHYTAGDGRTLLKQIPETGIFQPSSPGKENEALVKRRRVLLQALCDYGMQQPGLCSAAFRTKLNFARAEKRPPGKEFLSDLRKVHLTEKYVSNVFLENVCEYLIRTRNFTEMEALIAELRKSAPIPADVFANCLAFTRALMTVPEAQFEQVFSEAFSGEQIPSEVLVRSVLLAGEARKLSFSVVPYLLKEALRSPGYNIMNLLNSYLDFAASRQTSEAISEFFLQFYTLGAEALANASKKDPVLRLRLENMFLEIPLNLGQRYRGENNILEGYLLAMFSPQRPKLPERLERNIRSLPGSCGIFSNTSGQELDLFPILKTAGAFASPEEFFLPQFSLGNYFMQLNAGTKRKLIAQLDACREKTFGMKIVRALCSSWNTGPLIGILAEYLPEIRKMPEEKRAALWMLFRTLFGSHVLRTEPELRKVPELRKLIDDDTRKSYEAQYVRAMALSELPPPEHYSALDELHRLYEWFRKGEPAKAEKLEDHFIALALKTSRPLVYAQMLFSHLPDLRIWRKLKAAGIEPAPQNMSADMLCHQFRQSFMRVPRSERLRRFPELYLEFTELFGDLFGKDAAVQVIAETRFSTHAELAFLNRTFSEAKSDSPAVDTARKLFRIMDEAAGGKLSAESRREADRLGERLLKGNASRAERLWLSEHPEIFGNAPDKVELFRNIAAELAGNTGANPARSPDAYVKLLEILVRNREAIGKEKFNAAFAGFFRNCLEKFPYLNGALRKRMLPPLTDYCTWIGDKEGLESLKRAPAPRRRPEARNLSGQRTAGATDAIPAETRIVRRVPQ